MEDYTLEEEIIVKGCGRHEEPMMIGISKSSQCKNSFVKHSERETDSKSRRSSIFESRRIHQRNKLSNKLRRDQENEEIEEQNNLISMYEAERTL